MSSRTEEKQRRKAVRLQAERQAADRARHQRRLRLFGGGAAAVVVIGAAAAAAALALGGGAGDAGASKGLADGELAGAFGQHYAGMTSRREGAHVTTMMDTMGSSAHVHPKLSIVADGKPVAVPANIGIDPREDGMKMASLHTHDASGTIHVEGQENPTLGQFFAVWGVPLSADRLGPFREPVRMWVNGKRSRAYGALQLKDGEKISLVVGRGEPKL